jgi:hypothetical protein
VSQNLLVSQKTGYTTPPSPDFNLLAGNIQRRNINLSGPLRMQLDFTKKQYEFRKGIIA